ncbi:MAG: hypothetical protein IKS54_06410 [Erysipelotrichaceae bacterium]|nr:hypothetical protein [Erysipelotrichaceae bacterium]
MKTKNCRERIAEIEKNEADLINETKAKVESLKGKLQETSDQIEQIFSSGDYVNGENLVAEKTTLTAKIDFYETFLKKRQSVPLITEEEAREIKTELNDQITSQFIEDRKKIESLMLEIDKIAKNGVELINETINLGNSVNRLRKKNEGLFGIDTRITTMYNFFDRTANTFNMNTLPYISTLGEQKEK